MIVEPARHQDVAYVASAMRLRDIEEFMPLTHFETHGELAVSLVERFGEHPDVLSIGWENGPVAIAGMLLHRPNVGTLLFFATDDFPKIAPDFTRFVVQRWFPAYKARGVHRIECVSIDSYHEVHRWLSLFGLKREAVLKKFGRGGETYIQFAWVAE
jgi:hypothetical protein